MTANPKLESTKSQCKPSFEIYSSFDVASGNRKTLCVLAEDRNANNEYAEW